jgi:altronate hydrolase
MQEYIIINERDNVAVALVTLEKGKVLEIRTNPASSARSITLREEIPAGHKFSLCTIGKGDKVIKYGNPIGTALEEITPGSHVHIQNVKTLLGDILNYSYEPVRAELAPTKEAYFMGYRRPDGKVGIRNQIWIIPTVGCVNSIAQTLAREASAVNRESVDEILAFPHPFGCSQLGDDQANTMRILADLILHPNAAGVLVLGLGCENCNIPELKAYLGEYDEERIRFLQCQDTEDELKEGLALIEELIRYGKGFQREKICVKELVVGLKCGGSDGFSGITANPLVGEFSDLLISKGGTAILTEVPEMFGAETLLMNRCVNEEVFHKTVSMINDFKNYYNRHQQPIYENPSPGNKKGGITTLEDKSLGCTQKSGKAPVVDVLAYGERVKVKGLNLLSAPGNDLVASTALAAAGAHIVLFTTGRGTPFGCPVPTVKVSSNTLLAEKKKHWIDFNAGLLTEDYDRQALSEEFFRYILEVASGKRVKAEEAGYYEMAIFKQGVTL